MIPQIGDFGANRLRLLLLWLYFLENCTFNLYCSKSSTSRALSIYLGIGESFEIFKKFRAILWKSPWPEQTSPVGCFNGHHHVEQSAELLEELAGHQKFVPTRRIVGTEKIKIEKFRGFEGLIDLKWSLTLLTSLKLTTPVERIRANETLKDVEVIRVIKEHCNWRPNC